MSRSSRAIDKLINQIDSTPWGRAERALLDEALALAVDAGDEQREYALRMRLTSSAKMSGDTDAMLSAFAWCIGKHDSDPAKYPIDVVGSGAADLLWQYKWAAGTLSASPIFETAQIRGVLDDMQTRYTRAGVGMSAVHTAHFEVAHSNGWLDEAAEAYRAMQTTERDDYSHCDACVRSQSAAYLIDIGKEAEGIKLVEEMVDGGFSCAEEPERALAHALLPYLRAGKLSEAKNAHLRSYRDARNDPDNLGIIAGHLVFCAVTANEARGLAMVERHVGWLAHDGLNKSGQFSALQAFAFALDAVDRAGYGSSPVRGAEDPALAEFFAPRDTFWTVAELAEACWNAAESLADAFDVRNGNDSYARIMSRTRALVDERYELPIHSDGFAPASVAVQRPEPSTAAEWLELMRAYGASGDATGAIAAARSGLALESEAERAVLLGGLISAAVAVEQFDEAATALDQRIAILHSTGLSEQAALEERLGLALFGAETESAENTIAVLREELAAAEAPATVADVALALGSMLVQRDEFDEAILMLLAAIEASSGPETNHLRQVSLHALARVQAQRGNREDAESALEQLLAEQPHRGLLASALRLRARLRAGDGEYEAALADAEQALELSFALSMRDSAMNDCMLTASILDDVGRGEEAVARLRLALHQAELAESDTVLGVRFALGRQMVRSGMSAEGVELLTEIYQIESEAGAAPGSRAETLYWLANGLRDEEQYGAAVGAWRAAVELYEEAQDHASAALAGLSIGRLLHEAEVTDEALEALTQARSNALHNPERVSSYVDILHLLGRVQCESGDAAGLETLDEALQLATTHEAHWLCADLSDSRARGLQSLGRTDEAIAGILNASDLYLATGDQRSAGGSVLYGARVLSSLERNSEAVALYRTATGYFVDQADATAIVSLELADVLETLGQTAEANELRARFS